MSTNSAYESAVHRRFVRRRTGPVRPLWPLYAGGALFTALLVLTALTVQARTEQATRKALAEAGVSTWADAQVSGRHVRLTGIPPGDDAALAAERAVMRAEADSLLWRGVQPVRVTTRFAGPGAIANAGAADLRAPVWSFERTRTLLRLTGSVPDETSRQAIVEAANLAVGGGGLRTVINELDVSGDPAPDGHMAVMLRGLALLSKCETGRAGFAADQLSLTCSASENGHEAIRRLAAAKLPYGRLGPIEIRGPGGGIVPAPADAAPSLPPPSAEEIDTCNRSLADLLGEARIEFDSGSARIGASSAGLLDRVTEAAMTCPGNLRIEGHSDDTGLAELNDELSQARAEAVRAALVVRGVPAGRLVATGFGARRPRAGNDTEAGRARNRRIEIKVAPDVP